MVGIAPAGFTGTFDGEPPAAYIPVTTYAGLRGPSYLSTYSWRWIEMMVRRKPGVSIEQASADATRAAVQTWTSRRVLEPDLPSPAEARPSAILASLRLGAGPDPSLEARTALWVAGVAAIVLLIACANVSNLFLARGLRRQSEHAVRLALGGTRGRLLAESLTESLVLASLGSMAGLVVAQWGGATVRGLYTNDPMPMQIFNDVRTLAATAAITLAVGLIIGLVPALLAGHSGVASALRSGGRHGTYRGSRARSALLIVQAALSVVLLVGAAAAAERLRVALQAEMPGASYVAVRPFRERVDAERRSWRLGAMLFAAFGLLALIVAAVGLYAVIGYEVAQRRREVGIRVALGARSRDVVRLVLWQGARFALVGTALGCGLAIVGGRWIQPLLFQVSAADPAVYGAVVGVMLLVALGASALPAGRAARSDPNVALRSE